jgi:hypothetical protein
MVMIIIILKHHVQLSLSAYLIVFHQLPVAEAVRLALSEIFMVENASSIKQKRHM